MSYDAWGNRRDPDDWTLLTQSEIGNLQSEMSTDRGFTGHEMLDNVGLVHMNGRIYDPVIGRMISPDPIIQEPNNLQSFNRYSYVWNNPLSKTDPSGFVTEGLDTELHAADGNDNLQIDSILINGTVVPEPATIGMLGIGALITILIRKMRV